MITIDYRMCRSSGIGVYLRHAVRHLVADAGFDVALLGGDEVPGVSLHPPMRSRPYSLAEQVEMAVRTPRHTDVLWCPNYNCPFVSPGRLVVTVHDLCHVALPQLLDGVAKRRYARLMFNNVRRRAAHVICVSEFTRDELIRMVGVAPERISVVPSGLARGWSEGAVGEPVVTGPYLLFVGNVKPHKNLVRLLAAFERLKHRIPHRLVIVGRREGFLTPDRMVARAAEGLGDRVVFTGHVPTETIRSLYAHAALLVFPSLYEGFGLPPLEAMAFGIPVAASRAASIPEVCGEAAAYFDPYSVEDMSSVIERALGDEALRARLVSLGLVRAQRYPLASVGPEIGRVFRQVMAR